MKPKTKNFIYWAGVAALCLIGTKIIEALIILGLLMYGIAIGNC